MCVVTRPLNSLGKRFNVFRTTVLGAERDLLSSQQLMEPLQPLHPLHQYIFTCKKIKDVDFTGDICLVSVGLELASVIGLVGDE